MALGEWHRFGKPGMGMIETVEDPVERRRKICFLTPKGAKFVQRQLTTLYPEQDIELDAPTSREWLNKAYRARR
jgi:DNA-binding MarR family transcriptional regulator